MPDLLDLADVSQFWGNDLTLSSTGDLARAITTIRSEQRVLRRLLTNAGDYLTHTTYGAGLPSEVGETLDLPKLTATIKGQMAIEASVAQSPAPAVRLAAIPNGVSARVAYTTAPEKIPAVLSFNLDA